MKRFSDSLFNFQEYSSIERRRFLRQYYLTALPDNEQRWAFLKKAGEAFLKATDEEMDYWKRFVKKPTISLVPEIWAANLSESSGIKYTYVTHSWEGSVFFVGDTNGKTQKELQEIYRDMAAFSRVVDDANNLQREFEDWGRG